MGLTLGVHFETFKSEKCSKCVPDIVYRKFPPATCKPPGRLILEILALPKSCHAGPRPEGAYWWTDGQFLPPDDSCIYVTCSAFTPRSSPAWVSDSRLPTGRIMKVFLQDGNRPTGIIFKGSLMRNFPKIQTHPSGRYIGYVGSDSVKITTHEHEEVYNKFRDLRNANYRYCAFSPDGRHLAILQSASRKFELLISSTFKATTFNDECIELSSLLPGFKGRRYNEHLECKWSPDSQFIAVCSSIDYLFIMSKKLELVLDVTGDVLPEGVYPSWSSTFDYDPRFYHELLATGTSNRCVYIVNTVKKAVVMQTEPLGKDAIDCLQYNCSGEQIGVSTRDFKIFLLDSSSGCKTFSIDLKEQCPTLVNTYCSFPSVMRLGFSSKGDHLLTATCDGKVRVWQLPVDLSLFSLCKWEILSHVPASQLKHLPLPNKIKEILVSLPVSTETFQLII